VPCWKVSEGGSLLPSVALCLALGTQAFRDEVFLDTLCLPPCFTVQWLLETRVPFGEQLAEPLRREAPAPPVPWGSAHPAFTQLFAVCFCLLIS